MTQAIVCYNREGLALASDSLILQELDGGQVERLTERKLFPLGQRAAVLSVGAAIGARLSAELSQWLTPRRLEDFEDILTLSRDFLAQGFARFLRTHQAWAEENPACRQLYFIIAGYSTQPASAAPRAVMLQSEAGELPFQEVRLGRVFTLPRRLALEGRVTRQIAEGVPLRTLAESCLAGLASVAKRNAESVGGPFHVALITQSGIEFLEKDAGGGDGEE